MMISFAWPYIFLLAPLPLLLYFLLPQVKLNSRFSIRVPDLDDFSPPSFSSTPHRFKLLAYLMIWGLLLTAAARPIFVGEPIPLKKNAKDIMLAVDLSLSMQTKDFKIRNKVTDRLSALKIILNEFIEKRKSDRLGLILFGSEAYLQVPLTFDHVTFKQLLLEATIGLAGEETAIGDAIGLAIKQLSTGNSQSPILILLTDGRNTTGKLSPEKAAEIAAHEGLKIHTVAIGSKQGSASNFFGFQSFFPGAEIDERSLMAISEKTGGTYFRAYNSQELAQIYETINQLEAQEHLEKPYRPIQELYFYPLSLALIFSFVWISRQIIFKRQDLW